MAFAVAPAARPAIESASTLPRSTAAAPIEAAKGAGASGGTRGRRIESAGAAVTQASDANAALSGPLAAGPIAFEAVLVDCRMPGMDGFGFVEALRRKNATVPVVMMLAAADLNQNIDRLRHLHAGAYLIKPVLFPELLSRVDMAVKRFRSYRAMESTERRLRDWRREFENLAPLKDPGAPASPSIGTPERTRS